MSPETKRLIEKYFGPIPPGPALDRPKHWIPTLSGEKVVDIKDHVPQERTYFAWPTPAFFEPGDAELDLASLILTDGLSSRLKKSLVYDQQLCSNVISAQDSREISGAFLIWATARPGASMPRVEETAFPRDRPLGKRRSHNRGVEPREGEMGASIRHGTRAHRRFWRSGGFAESVQHISGRSGQVCSRRAAPPRR